MANKQQQQGDPCRAGYDQPGDTPTYNAYTQRTTNVFVDQPWVQQKALYNWTIPAILSCFFCFFPTGIFAIIAAVHARSSYNAGDYAAERTSTAWAKRLTITSVVIGVLTIILVIVLFVTLTATAVNTENKLINNLPQIPVRQETADWEGLTNVV